jgi:hypothetical protein
VDNDEARKPPLAILPTVTTNKRDIQHVHYDSNYDIIHGNSTGCGGTDLVLCNCSLLYDCEAYEVNRWVNLNSVDWFGSEDSWTRRHFPGPCEDVVLENNLELNLRSEQVGKCFSLDIKIGSEFLVELGAELNVMVESTGGDKL